MKIAYVINTRFPTEKAQSTHVMEMCMSFSACDHTDVRLFVPDRGPVLSDDPFSHYRVEPRFTFVRVPCFDALAFAPKSRVAFLIQTLTYAFHLRRQIKRWRPDVVYARDPYVFALLGRGMWKRVLEAHTLYRDKLSARTIATLDGIVCVTKALRDKYAEQYGSMPLLVEPDAVDEKMFDGMPSRESARRKLGVSERETLCLYTGKFTTMGEPKGLDESISAVKALRQAGESVALMAVGGTEDELSRYRPQAAEGIRLVGHLPKDELKTYYAAADIVLMPFPYSEHYALYMSPLKMFEYLFSGKPIVTSDLPSTREILNEENAYFCKPGDVESLKRSILTIMKDPSSALKKAEKAKADSTEYTWTKRAKRICDFLSRL